MSTFVCNYNNGDRLAICGCADFKTSDWDYGPNSEGYEFVRYTEDGYVVFARKHETGNKSYHYINQDLTQSLPINKVQTD